MHSFDFIINMGLLKGSSLTPKPKIIILDLFFSKPKKVHMFLKLDIPYMD